MAKCIRCGKSTLVRGFVRLSDSTICTPCFRSLGFKILEAGSAAAYKYDDIKNGKDAMRSARVEKIMTSNIEDFKIHGTSYDNEDGTSIQQILSEYAVEEYGDDKLTSAEVKEELQYEDRVYLYPTMDGAFSLEATTFDGAPAIKVYLETTPGAYDHIGWIPKHNVDHVLDLITTHEYELTGEILGGPYKYLDEDGKVASDSTDFGGRLYIAYK